MEVVLLINYYNELNDNGVVYSIDKLKLVGSCSVIEAEKLCRILGSKCSSYYMNNRPMKYKHNFTFDLLVGTVYIGVSQVQFGRLECSKNVIEYNPNKMGDNALFEQIRACWYMYNKNITVSEWDLAVDYPVDRNDYSLVKDNRNFQLNISRSKTEYLGVRHTNGFVKLYDKSYESELEYKLTRLEVTFRGLNDYKDVAHCFPTVRSVNSVDIDALEGLDRWIIERINESDDKEGLIKDLKKKSRRKYEKITPYLSANSKELKVNEIFYNTIVSHLREYENRLYEFDGFVLCQDVPFVD